MVAVPCPKPRNRARKALARRRGSPGFLSVPGFTPGRTLRLVRFPGRQGLALGQFALERRMLGEVVDQHVSPPAGQPRLCYAGRSKFRGQAVVETPECGETLEHLPMARRVCSAALDHVTSVLAVGADRLDELPALGQRIAQRRAQLVGLGSGEFVRLARDRHGDRFGLRTRSFDTEFLDQPPTGDLLYPLS